MSFPLASLALRVGVAVLVCLAVWSMANALRPDGKREPVRAQAVALVDERPPEPPPEIPQTVTRTRAYGIRGTHRGRIRLSCLMWRPPT